MPWISEEQINAAKEVDLLSYLQAREPWELKKSGSNEYRTKNINKTRRTSHDKSKH